VIYRLRLVLIFHLVLSSSSSFSKDYVIKGKVIDKFTQSSLPQARITLIKKNNQKIATSQTSELDGTFLIEHINEDSYTIKIDYLGYNSYSIDSVYLTQNIDLGNIELDQIGKDLNVIQIIGSKPLFELKPDKIIMNVAESAITYGNTIYEVLQRAPGINGVNLRGKELTLVIDDKLVNISGDELTTILQAMPASSVEKIELISNPSSKYDGRAKAILHIQPLTSKNDSWGGNVMMGIGTGKLFRENAGINLYYQKNKISFMTGIDHLSNPQNDINSSHMFIDRPANTLYFEEHTNRSNVKKYNSTFKADIDYKINPIHSIGINIRPSLNFSSYIKNNLAEIKTESNPSTIDSLFKVSTSTDARFQISSGSIYYKTTFDTLKNKSLLAHLDAYTYYENWKDEYLSEFLRTDYTSSRPSTLSANYNPIRITILSASTDYSHSTSLGLLEMGLKNTSTTTTNQFTWEDFKENESKICKEKTNHFTYKEYIQAAYAGLSKNYNKIDLQFIVRTEYTKTQGISSTANDSFTRDYLQFFPSANFTYKPCKNHEWFISYKKSINRPQYEWINPFSTFGSQNFSFKGNPYIIPQINHSVEITHSYNQTLISSISYTHMNHFIGSLTRTDTATKVFTRQFENYTYANIYSVNLSINKHITNWLSLNGGLTFEYFNAIHPEETSLKSTPRLAPTLTTILSLPYDYKIEISGYLSTPFLDGFYGHGLWYKLHVGIKKSFIQKKITASLSMNSLIMPYWYDSKQLFNRSFFKTNYDDRSILFSLSYTFGNKKLMNSLKDKTYIEEEQKRIEK